MKRIGYLFVLMIGCNISFAQNSILAGKIVDENNKPLPGAIISISRQGAEQVEARSDSDGLYCSKPIPFGNYNLNVLVNGTKLKTKTISLDDRAGSKEFFLIKVLNKKIKVSVVSNDPSLAVKLAKIEEEQKGFDFPLHGGIIRAKTDSAARARNLAPQIK